MHAVEKSTKAGFSHGAEMMMHEEQQRGKACRVVRWRSGRARVRVCAQVRSLGQAKPYEIADTAIIMQIHVIYRGGGATGGALNRIIFMIIIAFNHQTGGRPRVFLARVINCDNL